MKFGVRKPSLKKSIKARTTGRAKRAIKSSVNPLYGKKGMGLVNNPKKAVYNKVYNKTTVSAIPKGASSKKNNNNTKSKNNSEGSLLAAIWIISFIVILFNGKPLLNKFISFISVAFLSTVLAVIIDNKPNSSNYDRVSDSNKIDDEEYEFYANQANLYLKQVNESIKLINNTKNPDTFFQRYSLVLDKMNDFIDISKKVSYSGDDPEEYLEEFNENKISSFNDFINRYYEEILSKINNLKTEKAKLNNADRFYENIIKYEDLLEDNNIATADILYLQLKDHINKS